MKRVFCIVFLITVFFFDWNQLFAFEFGQLLSQERTIRYKHWNKKDKIITGYTSIQTQLVTNESKLFLVLKDIHTKPSGRTYLEKTTTFSGSEKKFLKYLEKDHRINMQVSSYVKNGILITQVVKGTEKTILEIKLEKEMIPFELLSLYLQTQIPILKKKGEIKFKLYLAMIALELEKNNLPTSFGTIDMVAKLIGYTQFSLNKVAIKAVSVVVQPTSLIIKSLLPRTRTEFQLVFSSKPPHEMLMFEENATQFIRVE